MKAILLAAGRGSRLRGMTENSPKCLVRLAGKSLLDWQLDALHGAGLAKVGVVRGYLSHLVTRPGLEAVENPRWNETNMVGSLLHATQWLRAEDCIISYTDIIYDTNDVRELAGATAPIAIAYDPRWLDLWSARFSDPLSDAETFRLDADHRLLEIGGKTTSIGEIQGQYMGLLKFTPEGWNQITGYLATLAPAAVDRLDMTSLLKALIKNGARIQAVPIRHRWLEVDNENDLALYEKWISATGIADGTVAMRALLDR